jgi:poly-gamma-glutamate capsule biosynthesis protein CapA/YwtB (metallophosphatase superfamily)
MKNSFYGGRLKFRHLILTAFALISFTILFPTGSSFAQTYKLPASSDTIKISFTGDVMQHGGQIDAALRMGDGLGYVYDDAFKYMTSRFKKADLMVANMEMTVGTKPYSGYPNFSAPTEIAKAAKESGIGLFLMANNHIADKGEAGLKNTFAYYESIGEPTTGVYKSKQDEVEQDPIIFTIKGVKFAFVNFTYDTNGMPVPEPYYVNLLDSTEVKRIIARARDKQADVIIACPHWGEEYHLEPSAEQKQWTKMLFREGVTVIVGSHPHVPEEAYIYMESVPGPEERDSSSDAGNVKKLVFYSMGNYISNQSDPAYTQVGTFLQLFFVKNNFTGKISIAMPKWEYTWCFRKGEFLQDYTVVPIEEFMNSSDYQTGAITPNQKAAFSKMKRTYDFIKNKHLVRIE